ncbi:sugar ABC transporter substrate-binding protein [Nocardioides sp. YIM 152588]|uniref:sugar ABC transporter substrate-binding protein n=1 Tax=Nocardioides sp. YIM 152588 TaxID=3158259 RepID=UPI0032E45AE3
MKRIPSRRAAVLLAACLAACLALAACASGSSSDSGGNKKLGIVVANISLNFAREMADGAQAAADDVGGIDLTVAGPATTDGPQEVQIFQNTLVKAPDGIVLENLAPDLFVRTSAQAIDDGTPVIALDTIGLPGSKITTYVGNDNYDLGATLAKEAIKRMDSDPSGVVVLGVPNPGVPVLDSRAQGIKDTFADMAPKVTIKGPYETFSDPGKSYNAWSSLVRSNKGALAFLGVGDADSYSLARIKKQEGGDYLTAGFDLDDQTLQAVKDGINFCTVSPEHYLKGYVAMEMLGEYATQDKAIAEGWIRVPGLVVDSSNIDKIIERQASQEGRHEQIAPEAQDIVANIGDYTEPYEDAR